MADVEKIIINEQSYPVKDVNAVSVLEQSLTAEQKAQVQANIGVTAATNVYTKSETDTLLNGKISTAAKGTSNGVAELDSNGKVPSSQLPSFVDDVVEGYYKTDNDRFYEESTFTTLIEPVAGKSWVDIPTNKSYRWTGSVYVRVDEGVQIGETSDTAYAGNKGKANADAITAIKDGVSINSFSDVETALAGKVDAVQGKGLSTNDYTSAEKTKLAGLENYDDTGIQGDISAIEEVIPSTATSQNQLATAADIPTDAVKYTAQTLTDAQKTQARTNIGVVQSDWNAYNSVNPDFIKNKPPVKVGQGTGGNLLGGTGMNNMNEATKQNSMAYGYGVSAKGDYSMAFGYFLQALHDYEIAFGKFNQSNADTVFSIGDGTSNSDRHNLMELKTNGTVLLNGNAVKTEGGDDKLRLGQITADGKYGLGRLFTVTSSTTVTFLTTDVPFDLSTSTVYKLGDFYVYSSSGIKIAPIAGYIGISKTGQWIHAENCYAMFYNCSGPAMTSFDVSMLDTSEVKNMGNMFYNCSALTSLDLSTFDTSEVKNMSGMFYGCSSLTSLDLSSFDMSNVVEYNQMFGAGAGSAPPLTTLKTPKINPHDDIPLPRTLYSQDGTAYTNLPVTTGTSIELRQSWT